MPCLMSCVRMLPNTCPIEFDNRFACNWAFSIYFGSFSFFSFCLLDAEDEDAGASTSAGCGDWVRETGLLSSSNRSNELESMKRSNSFFSVS